MQGSTVGGEGNYLLALRVGAAPRDGARGVALVLEEVDEGCVRACAELLGRAPAAARARGDGDSDSLSNMQEYTRSRGFLGRAPAAHARFSLE
jgi:hypothetical protein